MKEKKLSEESPALISNMINTIPGFILRERFYKKL